MLFFFRTLDKNIPLWAWLTISGRRLFRQNTVSSNDCFVKQPFRRNTGSSKKPIRRNTGSSKNRFVKMLVRQNASPEFVKRPVRQKNGSSKKRFVKKPFRQKTGSSKNRFVKNWFVKKSMFAKNVAVSSKNKFLQKRCCFANGSTKTRARANYANKGVRITSHWKNATREKVRIVPEGLN